MLPKKENLHVRTQFYLLTLITIIFFINLKFLFSLRGDPIMLRSDIFNLHILIA